MKQILVKTSLGLGNSVWVERTAYGAIAAKAEFHPDDPISTLLVGTPRQCFKATQSVVRAVKNNRLGKIHFARS